MSDASNTVSLGTQRVRLRRAEPADVDFILSLATHEDVEPYLAARGARDRDAVLAEVERSQREPEAFGRMIVEVDGVRAGVMGYERTNERSRIAHLGGLAIHPDFRGRHLADDAARLLQRYLIFELGYHRLQLEIYGFNERAMRHAERAGFVREGVKRKAYWRHGEWVDGVLYGLVREDLVSPPVALLYDHVRRFNEGVRDGDFATLLAHFADDAELAFEGVPVGPFRGRDAIAAAYRKQPPHDEVDVLEVSERDGGVVVARYAWRRDRERAAGELRLTAADGKIARLVVTFDQEE